MLLVSTEVKASSIAGLGLFAAQFIPAGVRVWEFNELVDITYTDEQFKSFPESMQQFLRTYGYRSVEDGVWTINLDQARHMNHSPHPTLSSDADSNYYAVRDIEVGEELTCDYVEFAVEGCIDGVPAQQLGRLEARHGC